MENSREFLGVLSDGVVQNVEMIYIVKFFDVATSMRTGENEDSTCLPGS